MEQDRRVTVAEAATILGITKDAVRKRIARGTLQADKQDDTWTVVLDGDQQNQDSHYWELIQHQQAEIDRLRSELQRKDHMIDKLIERIPPAIPEPRRRTWPWEKWFR